MSQSKISIMFNNTLHVCAEIFTWWTLMCRLGLVLPYPTHNFNHCTTGIHTHHQGLGLSLCLHWVTRVEPSPSPLPSDSRKSVTEQQLSCSPWTPGMCHSWPPPPPSWPTQAGTADHHCFSTWSGGGDTCGSSWGQFEPAMWQDHFPWSTCHCKC